MVIHWDYLIVPYQSREMCCNLSLGKFDFWFNSLSESSYIGFHSQSLKILWKPIKYLQRFLTFKGYSATAMFLGLPGNCQFTLLNFYIIPNRYPWCLTGGKTSQVQPQKLFEYFMFSPVNQAVPTRVIWQGVFSGFIIKECKSSFFLPVASLLILHRV